MRIYNLILAILICGCFLMTGCRGDGEVYSLAGDDEADLAETSLMIEESAEAGSEKATEEGIEESECVYVYVCGAVQKEGVYLLSRGSRKAEALELAGGYMDEAARGVVNLAEEVSDGEKIYFPFEGEERTALSDERLEGGDGLLDLNSAGKEELMKLPGIGEGKAETIIEYRKKNGGFNSVEELMQVSGIKEGTFEKIRPYVKVR